jgi:hypothetical protein
MSQLAADRWTYYTKRLSAAIARLKQLLAAHRAAVGAEEPVLNGGPNVSRATSGRGTEDAAANAGLGAGIGAGTRQLREEVLLTFSRRFNEAQVGAPAPLAPLVPTF